MKHPTLTDHMPAGKPDAEFHVDDSLVLRLLQTEHPDLADLPLRHLDSGWDNVLFRLGDEFVVRVPRREIAAKLMRNEQAWLPGLSPRLPVPISEPVRMGHPTAFYPWHWSIVPWYAGRCADEQPVAADQATVFADFLLALHQAAPDDAPENPVRGIPIQVREENTLERMARVREKTDLISPAIEAVWQTALAAPPSDKHRWLHGDLHAQNVLVDDKGRICAVIDWGDLTAGDVATDLAGIWALFESADARREAIDRYQPSDALLARARGWAALFGVVLVDSGLINSPRHARAGGQILHRLANDTAG
jgi:aminoglycoside phosphotransferase (APT) family kinase protein